ncbi:MAG: ATPase [Treponema sp.]|jgi:hypothetical protein|nr:ATPase [Treponema sp.]
MEELQTTEVLDREILEDARKKAYRILKTADDEVKAQGDIWERKIRESLDELRDKYTKRIFNTREEIMARLPLDKRRSESEYIEGLLADKVEAFLSGLARSNLLAVLERSLAKRLAEFIDSVSAPPAPGVQQEPLPFKVTIRNISRSEAGALLERCLQAYKGRTSAPSCFSLIFDDADASLTLNHRYPCIILDAGIAIIRASVEDSVDILLEDKRSELTCALLGEQI